MQSIQERYPQPKWALYQIIVQKDVSALETFLRIQNEMNEVRGNKYAKSWIFDLNEAFGADDSPLLLASRTSSVEVVEILLKRNAKVNRKDDKGLTALHFAVIRGTEGKGIVALLLEYGADINVSDKSGYTPFKYAVLGNGREITKFLIEKGAKAGSTLISAVQKGNKSMAVLLEHGWDINAVDENGFTLLDFAVIGNQFEATKFLIEKGAKVGRALLLAVKEGNQPMVALLLEHSEDINAVDEDGLMLLDFAVIGNQFEVTKFLIEKGASISSAARFLVYKGRCSPEIAAYLKEKIQSSPTNSSMFGSSSNFFGSSDEEDSEEEDSYISSEDDQPTSSNSSTPNPSD